MYACVCVCVCVCPTLLLCSCLTALPPRTVEEDVKCVAGMLLENPERAQYTVAFKVKTTMPDRYTVVPSMGLLAPGTSLRIVISMDEAEQALLYPRVRNAKVGSPPVSDKFLVQVSAHHTYSMVSSRTYTLTLGVFRPHPLRRTI